MAAKIRPNTMSIMLQIRRFGFVFVAIARLLKWFARYTTGVRRKNNVYGGKLQYRSGCSSMANEALRLGGVSARG